MIPRILCALLSVLATATDGRSQGRPGDGSMLEWKALPQLPAEQGVAGPFAGVHDNALIVAGGANFPDGVPWHPTADGGVSLKRYYDTIHVLVKSDGSAADAEQLYEWSTSNQTLPSPAAYGVSLSTDRGILCVGGERLIRETDEETGEVVSTTERLSDVFLLIWNGKENRLQVSESMSANDGTPVNLPDLPVATTAACGAVVGGHAYVVGGDTGEGGTTNCWRLNLSPDPSDDWLWERVPSWTGPARSHAIAVGQGGKLFLFSGRNKLGDQPFQIFTDAWCFDPAAYERELERAVSAGASRESIPDYASGWTRIADIAPAGEEPRCVMAGTGAAVGFDCIAVFGGARGDVLLEHENVLPAKISDAEAAGDNDLAQQLRQQRDDLYDKHAGFSSDILLYHITTDNWTKRGEMPESGPVTTTAVNWGNAVVIPSGESSPGIRTRSVWMATVSRSRRSFGTLNWLVLGGYLTLLVAMGVFFSRRESGADDYFLAAGRIPWWAAGLSIFATTLSAITYLAIPARTYTTNWNRLILNLGIPVVAVVVVFVYLPFFRRVRVASAYDFLEQRFSVSVRIFGSLAFVLFQLGRMGIVLLLPALALSAVTGIDVYVCIIAMGALSTLYTVLGGIEAVVWTDVVQAVVLIGGAAAALSIMAGHVSGGLAGIVTTAFHAGKFDMISDFRFHDLSWAKDGILVMLLGSFFTSLLPYTSDQSIIQRYLTVATEHQARRAIWTNAVVSIPASLLFFFVGSALWTFYTAQPDRIGPLQQADQTFPWFIAQEMPAGLAGLVIAGVFAAAMSSLDSSMHSVATVGTTDFYERFGRKKNSRESLATARRLTVLMGLVGTGSAVFLAMKNVTYLWDYYLTVVGICLGALGGLFTLGILSRRAGSLHAWLGILAAGTLVVLAHISGQYHSLLDGGIAVTSCVVVGIASSWLLPIGVQSPKFSTGN
ncbi:MAG: sodium/solute symporter [Planctomycetaceae bacterium]